MSDRGREVQLRDAAIASLGAVGDAMARGDDQDSVMYHVMFAIEIYKELGREIRSLETMARIVDLLTDARPAT